MTGGKILEQVEIDIRDQHDHVMTVYIDVHDNSLSKKWLLALDDLLKNGYHLEKNYCFFGFADGPRNGSYVLDQINKSIEHINRADIGYHIDDYFSMENTMTDDPIDGRVAGRNIIHDKFNHLHRYFEDLQGQSGRMSSFFLRADARTRWHIRQLNLLCHEFESWALSYRKQIEAPEWQRPSQLMCWLNAPRFSLDDEDHDLFGVDTINRPLGGVFVGVNKSVGKHHWEVFNDEGRDSRLSELVTSSLISQTEGSGDFDIEWANNPGDYVWQKIKIKEFREWLIANNFDPEDKRLTIGHPQIGQVDLERSFGSNDYRDIWQTLNTHLDVYAIRTGSNNAVYDYRWDDANYVDLQVEIIEKGN
jgi:hypothetical protein